MIDAYIPLSGKEFETRMASKEHDKMVTAIFDITTKTTDFFNKHQPSLSKPDQAWSPNEAQARLLDLHSQYIDKIQSVFSAYKRRFNERFATVKKEAELAKQMILKYRQESPVFQPFDVNLFMEHFYSVDAPKIVNTLKMYKERMTIFDRIDPKNPDIESMRALYMDLRDYKLYVTAVKELFDIKSTRGLGKIDAELVRRFFPGYVPDYAKIYMEDIQMMNKEAENAFKMLDKAKPAPYMKVVDEFSACMESEAKKVATRFTNINGINDEKLMYEAMQIYVHCVTMIRGDLQLMTINVLNYGFYALLAFEDVAKRTISLLAGIIDIPTKG